MTNAGPKDCYFVPKSSMHRYASASSLLQKGLIEVAGKQGNTLLYYVTPEGRKLAQAYVVWQGESL